MPHNTLSRGSSGAQCVLKYFIFALRAKYSNKKLPASEAPTGALNRISKLDGEWMGSSTTPTEGKRCRKRAKYKIMSDLSRDTSRLQVDQLYYKLFTIHSKLVELIGPTSAKQGRFLKVFKSAKRAPILDLRLGKLWEERRASTGALSYGQIA